MGIEKGRQQRRSRCDWGHGMSVGGHSGPKGVSDCVVPKQRRRGSRILTTFVSTL